MFIYIFFRNLNKFLYCQIWDLSISNYQAIHLKILSVQEIVECLIENLFQNTSILGKLALRINLNVNFKYYGV